MTRREEERSSREINRNLSFRFQSLSLSLSPSLSFFSSDPPLGTRCRYISVTRDIETVLDSINTERL